MACIYKFAALEVDADTAWDVIERYTRSAVHVFPSLSIGERQDGDYRVVTMPDGREVHELNISIDPDLRRSAYTIPGIPGVEHHHAVMQVLEDGEGNASLVWTTDVRPDQMAETLAPMYDIGFPELLAAVNQGG